MTSAKRYLTRPEMFKAHALLEQTLTKDGEFWEYDGDWSDAKIAKEISPTLESHHIRNLRMEMFGSLKRYNTQDDSRVDELDAQCALLKSKLDDLEGRYNRLCDNLSVNRIADVRHLKTEEKKGA